jgi:SPP1 gp7 family putative phage head morphogenesis protein
MTSPEHLRLIENLNRTLAATETRIADRINRALASAFLELEEELRRKYPEYQAQGGLVAYQRKLLLLDQLKELLNPASGRDFRQDFEELLRLADGTGIEMGQRLMEISGEDFVRATATIPLDALRYAAEEQTRYLSRYGDEFASKASAAVEQALIQGWGVARLSKVLRDQLELTKKRADIIARTASLSASNAAAENLFRGNGVEWIQWMATIDSRVCRYCSARNGNMYELGATRPPIHFQDRCFIVPVKKKFFEKGLIKEDWIRDHRAKGLAELEKKGLQPDYGISPFERASGLESAPKPVWRP